MLGSYADGTFTDESDIDLAIFSDYLTYVELVDLEMILLWKSIVKLGDVKLGRAGVLM